ncbi:DNA methylase N-4/N-6 [Pandoravirus inopinatum]|uniref:site-specific DNA-methyltransferase (cytosine-N(4)-specific) n=1 Tax=Pandoravirus inopinatum TaxID=1605721 RepID=A0A0B5J7C6_9VIRU|nr:DNA methylase N-4/N-6 [Pandoravirus inopinatum]AJF97750.1 DNA methylase N-4/N-6 [Pandoravirus inopinatum]
MSMATKKRHASAVTKSDQARPRKQRRRASPFAWTGQFRPELASAHIDTYAPAGSRVWDPFVGSGTVLLACVARTAGIVACGTDVNPAAVTMANVASCAAWDHERRAAAIAAMDDAVARCADAADAVASQDDLIQQRPSMDADVRLLADALLCRTERPGGGARTTVGDAWPPFRAFIEALPLAEASIEARMCDARASGLPDASVDLVLTSPPYINVINYHQQYRGLMERLGWRVLSAAPSEIGANRKHRSNRLLTIVQYCLDMGAVLDEMARVCKSGARAILVVGRESKVAGASIPNSRIVERLATEAGRWRRAGPTEERSFVNRFGQQIVEDVLHLSPIPPPTIAVAATISVTPLSIALDVLAAIDPGIVGQTLLAKAVATAPSVRPSALFDHAAVAEHQPAPLQHP